MAALLHTKPALTQDIQWQLWCSGQQWKIHPVELCFINFEQIQMKIL